MKKSSLLIALTCIANYEAGVAVAGAGKEGRSYASFSAGFDGTLVY
jgi:hypothetical protein